MKIMQNRLGKWYMKNLKANLQMHSLTLYRLKNTTQHCHRQYVETFKATDALIEDRATSNAALLKSHSNGNDLALYRYGSNNGVPVSHVSSPSVIPGLHYREILDPVVLKPEKKTTAFTERCVRGTFSPRP